MQPSEPERSITLWGPPTSGKTTFLAALSIALARQEHDWRLVGADESSTETLIKLTTQLARDRAFPNATQGIEHHRWTLVGRVSRAIPRRWFGTKRREEPIKVNLDLIDAAGEISSPDMSSRGARDQLIDNLVHSRGIVFFFDAIREFNMGDAFDYTFGVLTQLAQRMTDSPDYASGYLPHYVAVCVTKIDEIRIFRTAEKLNLLVNDPSDPYGFPRVDDNDARELFVRLCEVSHSGNAELIPSILEKAFRPDRIKYFASSAIGFHVDSRNGVYNPDDYQNQVADPDYPESTRIRGSIHPINVVEPLFWICQQLTPGIDR